MPCDSDMVAVWAEVDNVPMHRGFVLNVNDTVPDAERTAGKVNSVVPYGVASETVEVKVIDTRGVPLPEETVKPVSVNDDIVSEIMEV